MFVNFTYGGKRFTAINLKMLWRERDVTWNLVSDYVTVNFS